MQQHRSQPMHVFPNSTCSLYPHLHTNPTRIPSQCYSHPVPRILPPGIWMYRGRPYQEWSPSTFDLSTNLQARSISLSPSPLESPPYRRWRNQSICGALVVIDIGRLNGRCRRMASSRKESSSDCRRRSLSGEVTCKTRVCGLL